MPIWAKLGSLSSASSAQSRDPARVTHDICYLSGFQRLVVFSLVVHHLAPPSQCSPLLWLPAARYARRQSLTFPGQEVCRVGPPDAQGERAQGGGREAAEEAAGARRDCFHGLSMIGAQHGGLVRVVECIHIQLIAARADRAARERERSEECDMGERGDERQHKRC